MDKYAKLDLQDAHSLALVKVKHLLGALDGTFPFPGAGYDLEWTKTVCDEIAALVELAATLQKKGA